MRDLILRVALWLVYLQHAAGSGSSFAVQITKSATAAWRQLKTARRSSFLAGHAVRDALQYKQHVFTCQITLGDGTRMMALVDTGSSNIVAPSRACSSRGCEGHRKFRSEDDDDGHFVGSASSDIRLSYASGHLTGSGFSTRICLGEGACGRASLVLAAFESDEFEQYPFDAILGLGPPRQAAGGDYNIVNALTRDGVLSTPSFMLGLRASGASSLTFGVNVSNFTGNATWLPADARHGEWAVPLADFAVDGTRVEACGAGGCRAVLDSGTAGIAVPKHIAQVLRAKLQVSDCSELDDMPKLGFALGGRLFEIGADRYVEVSKVDASHCRLLVREIDDGETQRTVILGQPFLMERLAFFDQAQMRVGLLDLPLSPA